MSYTQVLKDGREPAVAVWEGNASPEPDVSTKWVIMYECRTVTLLLLHATKKMIKIVCSLAIKRVHVVLMPVQQRL